MTVNATTPRHKVVRFGLFSINLEERSLTKRGVPIRLQEKPYQILVLLLERAGEIVSREELHKELWQSDVFVRFDDGLNTAMKKLRSALEDSSENPVFIETIPRRGYRFLAPAEWEYEKPDPSEYPPSRTGLDQRSDSMAGTLTLTPGRSRQRWLFASITGIILLAGLIFGLIFVVKFRTAAAGRAIRSIIVLPVENLSGDPSLDPVAEGFTDSLTMNLARLGVVRVISRNSAMQYKDHHRPATEIAREVNVDGVVAGSLDRDGDRLLIRSELIDAAGNQSVWAGTYKRGVSELSRLEDELAQSLASQVGSAPTRRANNQANGHRPIDPQAHEEYLQALQFWKLRTASALAQAVEHYNRAIDRDPQYAEAWAGLANCYIVLPMLSSVPRENAQLQARQAAEKAISLDDSLAVAHLAVAEVKLYDDWDFAGAEKEFKRALVLNPNYAQGYQWYAEFLSLMGKHSEAIAEIQTAQQLDPLSMIVYHQAGQIYQAAHRYDDAFQQYRKALQIEPGFAPTYSAIADMYRRQNDYRANLEAQHQAVLYWEPAGRVSADLKKIEEAYATGGEHGYLLAEVEFEKKHPSRNYLRAWNFALLGKRDTAIQMLEKSFEDREIEILGIRNDPELDSLRSDPRFQDIVRKIGFPST